MSRQQIPFSVRRHRSQLDLEGDTAPAELLICGPDIVELHHDLGPGLVPDRCGRLVEDETDGATVEAIRQAVIAAGATVKIVAPKVGGAVLADGSKLAADGQLAGTPSVMFDAVAAVLSADGAAQLAQESAALDFVCFAYAHLKAIAADDGGNALLARASLKPDNGVVPASDTARFIAAAKTRQWDREPQVRMLA